jgi:tocopherol cyclase
MFTNLVRRFRALRNPDMFHGWGATRRYFEGWYFKLVDPSEQYAFAVIPGISYGIDGKHHAFIQVLDGKRCQASYHEFETESFRPSGSDFKLHLGANFFSNHDIRLDLPELSGALHFRQPFPWPKTLGAPGIMGWYAFMPFMECYHGVLSMHHQIEGTLKVYDQIIDFSGGKGYMEKDWGRSFPGAWIWTQSNHFGPGERVSVMASVADIPWLSSRFTGFISGLLLEDRLFRFATYTGAKLKVHLGEHRVEISLRQKGLNLMLQANQAGSGELIAPIQGNMTGKVNESMQATVNVELRENSILLYEGTGRNAGLEVAGKVETLC